MADEKSKVLIVEDEAIVSLDISRRLEKLGYEVVGTVASGDEALSIAHSNPPDLVLMDINIQGELDGIETAEKIYAEHNVPVIYLTAYGGESILQRAKQTRPFGYILKPFKERELRAAIEIALVRHREEKK